MTAVPAGIEPLAAIGSVAVIEPVAVIGSVAVIEPVEIPWWAWLLIWAGLVLALVVMLALFAWWLFRKGMRLLDDVADLAESVAVLEVDEPRLPRQQLAVLAQARDIRRREDARRAHRAQRRRERHERRLARARRITRPDAAARAADRLASPSGYHESSRSQP